MKIKSEAWTDGELQWLLEARENTGMTFEAISQTLDRSRNSCIGAYGRIMRDLERSEAA